MENQTGAGSDPLEEMFHKLYRPLYCCALAITRDVAFSEDLAIEQIYEFYLAEEDLRSEVVRKRLFVAVRNRCINELKRKNARSRREKEWVEMNQSDEFQELAEVKAEVYHRYLEMLLAQLPERTRQAVMGHLNKIPAKKMARIMGIHVSTYHTLKDRGIKRIKELAKESRLPMWFILLLTLVLNDNWKN